MQLSGTLAFTSGKAGDFDIWSLNLDSLNLSQLTVGDYVNDTPKWSPDGSRIVFTSTRTGVPEIWVMKADGSEQTQLTRSNKYHADPAWSPDGKHIVCSANYDDSENFDLYIIKANASGSPEKIASFPGADAGPCWSPDGSKIIFSASHDNTEDIWELNLSSKAVRQISSHKARDYSPVYSPDGRWIAFISEADEHSHHDKSADADVWIMSRDGLEERQITKNTGADRFVAWSPDGQYLVCCSGRKDKLVDRINILSLASGEPIDFSYSREELEKDIGSDASPNSLFGRLLPDFLRRKTYPENYFGTERSPHWKR